MEEAGFELCMGLFVSSGCFGLFPVLCSERERPFFPNRGALSREPWRAFVCVADTNSALPLADIIDTLVIEADGTVSPVQHGFDRAHAFGQLA
jgi:hypothetical protein